MDKEQQSIKWAVEHYDIPEKDILWYNSGICYDRIGVRTLQSVKKVQKKLKGRTVNGGVFDGMPLGNFTTSGKGKDTHYDVYC